jgi:A1 cistron-splicing factor AAR2
VTGNNNRSAVCCCHSHLHRLLAQKTQQIISLNHNLLTSTTIGCRDSLNLGQIADSQQSKSMATSSSDGVGSILIIPDVPLGLDFGINCMNFETGPKFKGLSTIPDGLHFIYHSTGMAARQGFFWRAQPNEIAVRQWDSREEHICSSNKLSADSLATLVQQLNSGDLNGNLGPYQVAEHHVWLNLSCFIHEGVLLKANCPIGEIIYPSEAHDLETLNIPNSSTKQQKSGNHDQKLRANKFTSPIEGNFARFVKIDACEVKLRDTLYESADHSSRARDLTSLYIDKSLVLNDLVATEYNNNWENILGELQLSFLLFLLVFCYDSLEHWKRLVDTICRSEKALISKPDFTVAFIRILYEQLNFSPADFFANELSKDNFLRPAMSRLFENLKQPAGVLNSSVQEHRKRLLTFFQKKFDLFQDSGEEWKLGMKFMNLNCDELNSGDEDKPTVVDASEFEASNSRIKYESDCETIHVVKDMTTPTEEILSMGPLEPEPVGTEERMTPLQLEIAMFSWRYPNLYDSMCVGGLNEDFEMAAVRVLFEMDMAAATEDGSILSDALNLARLESKLFLEEEVSKRTIIM